jgi:hypothetical protein
VLFEKHGRSHMSDYIMSDICPTCHVHDGQGECTKRNMVLTQDLPTNFFGLPGGADSHRLATHSNQASPTAGGPRQNLTSEIRLTPLSQEVPSARTKIVWELKPHTSLVCYSDCQRSATMHTQPVFTGRPNKGVSM